MVRRVPDPAPVLYIGLAMWAGALIAPACLPYGKRKAVHRLRWFEGVFDALRLQRAGAGLPDAMLSGLHTQRRARFQFTQLLAGMWQPKPLGVVQIYGVIGLGESLDEARQ